MNMNHTNTSPFHLFAGRHAFFSMLALMALLLAGPAHAGAPAFDVPFVTQIGCAVVTWMKGPLAVLVFVLVVIATFVIGMIAKMDWSRIINIAVIFGILTALGGFLANSSYVQSAPALAACLR